MADRLQQAMIGDDPHFRVRVRAAITELCTKVTTSSIVDFRPDEKVLARQVILDPDLWSIRVARGLAAKTGGVDAIDSADDITDDLIDQFLPEVFAAFLTV